MGPHGSMPGRAMHGTDQSQRMLCCPLLQKHMATRVIRVHLISFSQSWLPQQTWEETKSQSLHVIHLPSHRNFLASDSMGMHSPAQAREYLSSATTSGISNEICWKGKLSWPEKERAFSIARQELTSVERGLHTRTVPLCSYCSAGSCFWSVCMCCQSQILNIAMNSATDSTAMDFQLPNGKLAWYHRGTVLRVRLSYGAMHIKCP